MTNLENRAELPAVVLIAHDKPRHLRRLLGALAPLPIFLHIDANTNGQLYAEMIRGLGKHVRLQPRLAAGWARFEVVQAELEGYRSALAQTDAKHIIVATGADYPLASVEVIVQRLAATHRSYAEILPLPISEWGALRGYDRFLFRSFPWRGHRLAWPIPRRLWSGLRLGGGAQTKILSRRHAQMVLDVLDHEPEMLRWFTRCWTPDEVMIPTLLLTERFGACWTEQGSASPHPWHIDWGDVPAKNPRWLGLGDLPALHSAANRSDVPALFARKFGDDSDELVAAIDARLRLPGASA